MIIKYQSWLTDYKELNSESGTQTLLDASNDTNNKAKVKSGKLSASDVAKENHNKKLHYEFCVFTESEDVPYCYVSVIPRNKHIGVNFLDEAGREYLAYAFHEIREDHTLFLREIWYYHFASEAAKDEEYRIHYAFDEQGDINYRKYDEKNQKIQDFEGNKRFDISGLYEAYPEFGQYESLIRLERNLPLDIEPPNTAPDNTTDLPNNGWLPPGWNKS
ncbi:hypothetical protein KHS38_20205 [Mucilaginibacter sp. Bleaf8]|uniref:hypothetical protein n=1 Tax=Mucilaginibacter sp. Bleaf8 TaxID=2834430 RepID=UPI001BCEE0F8|nr:hypothetical protein [Mucilaginibacter sp. Bleaf8]MBS7566739.1 hypothetical protein [Mucilaginibacter sp. Bleaf8]